jgi:hypothetical protein
MSDEVGFQVLIKKTAKKLLSASPRFFFFKMVIGFLQLEAD